MISATDGLFDRDGTESRPGVELTQEQLVDRIRTLNPSAPSGYLMGFRREALASYLDHLQLTLQPRGRTSWVRRSETPAIVRAVNTN
jgi:hypothetical protein